MADCSHHSRYLLGPLILYNFLIPNPLPAARPAWPRTLRPCVWMLVHSRSWGPFTNWGAFTPGTAGQVMTPWNGRLWGSQGCGRAEGGQRVRVVGQTGEDRLRRGIRVLDAGDKESLWRHRPNPARAPPIPPRYCSAATARYSLVVHTQAKGVAHGVQDDGGRLQAVGAAAARNQVARGGEGHLEAAAGPAAAGTVGAVGGGGKGDGTERSSIQRELQRQANAGPSAAARGGVVGSMKIPSLLSPSSLQINTCPFP